MALGNILVVEDNPITRKMVRFALESEGYEVREAGDGSTGLERAAQRRPDLVVQDYVLPDMDGLHLLQKIRALPAGETIPVLLVTGMASQIEDLGLQAVGPTTVLPKPLEPSRMLEIVHQYLSPEEPAAKRGHRVLVVDDEALTCKLAALRLGDAGFEVECAGNGEEGLRKARESRPDAILSDVLMPGMDGFSFCRAVREDDRLRDVPVVLLSSSFLEEGDRHLARRVGASALLTRTPDFGEAIGALIAALETDDVPPSSPGAEVEALHVERLQAQLQKQLERNEALLRQGSIQAAALSVVRGLAQALASTHDLPSMLGDVLVHCLDAAGLSTGLLYLPQADGKLRLRAQAGLPSDLREAAADCFGHPEILQRAFDAGQPAAYRFAVETDPAVLEFGKRLGRTCLIVPFVCAGEPLGGLLMASDSHDLTEPAWRGFAAALGMQFGQTIAVGRFMAKGAASEIRHQTLMENANDAILVVDGSGHVLEANHSAQQLLGRVGSELVGHPYREFVVPEQLGDVSIETKRVEGRRLLRPDGSTITVDLSVARAEVGETTLGLVILRDVTEKAALEAQLRQAQKMEAIGRLAGGVAHDFNNILSVITGFSDLAKRQLAPEHPAQARLDQILKASSRAGDLTRQMLAFSRRQVMRPRSMSLNEAIEALHPMLGRLIGEDNKLVTRLDAHLGTVVADPTQIDQVLLNLAVNARDAMETGGILTFETANVDLDEGYVRRHLTGRPGSYVMLSVSDTGIGMDEVTRSQIFEPFFTTKAEGKGTGMGLATVYGIVKQSDGFIWVYSEPGHGATFKIYLPRAEATPEPEAVAREVPAAREGTETVLLVEDQDALREMIQELLEQHGYTVLAAADGEAALQMATEHQGPLHLLLTDIIMPGMNGPELAQRLSALRPAARALYMSGFSNGAVTDRGLLTAGAHLIEKPFSGESLAKAVRRALGES